MIPLATTSVTVLRVADADLYAEPYSGTDVDDRTEAATDVRAVIGQPSGREVLAGGEQAVWDFQLVCDPVDLVYTDLVKDQTTGFIYRVVWVQIWPGEHVEAGLRNVQGET